METVAPVERNTGRFASYIAWNQEGEPVSKGGLKRGRKMAVSGWEKKGARDTASPGGVRFVAIKKIAWC